MTYGTTGQPSFAEQIYKSTKCSRILRTKQKSSEIETQLHTALMESISFIYTPSLCECMEIKMVTHPGETSESGD